MSEKRQNILLAASLLSLVSPALLLTQRQCDKPAPASQAPAPISATDQEQERLLAIGRKIFVARCASCHNERGDKPLRAGSPLAERKLTPEQIARGAGGRLRDRTEEEQRAVALYIESFLKK